MQRWRRVGGTPGHVVGAFAFGLVGAVATVGLLYALIAGSGDVISWPGVLGAFAFVAALTGLAFRYALVGVFVNETGVRNRSMWHAQTVAWPEIRRFETRPATEGAHVVWVLLKDHSALRTSLVYRDRPLPSAWSRFVAPARTTEAAQQALRDLRAAQQNAER